MEMTCEHCGKGVTGQYCHACGKAASKAVVSGSTRKVLGVCLIVGPWLGLMLVLSAYAITSFITSSLADSRVQTPFIESAYAGRLPADSTDHSGYSESMVEATNEAKRAYGSMISTLLSLVGLFCMAGILVGTPVGIYLLATDGKKKE